jgi:TetR/AcrR family transcriptional repressor of nem operon
MKISKEQAQQNHDRVVATAADLFRVHGFDGIGVADLMKRAGFTHGGFYNHFPSKEALAVKATALAFKQRAELVEPGADIGQILKKYISEDHLNDRSGSCPATGLSGDAARQTDEVKAVFVEGIEGMIRTYVAAMGDKPALSSEQRRALALNVMAKAVGAVMLARALPDQHALAHEIIQTCLAGALSDVGSR